jgi:hypothetical protein
MTSAANGSAACTAARPAGPRRCCCTVRARAARTASCRCSASSPGRLHWWRSRARAKLRVGRADGRRSAAALRVPGGRRRPVLPRRLLPRRLGGAVRKRPGAVHRDPPHPGQLAGLVRAGGVPGVRGPGGAGGAGHRCGDPAGGDRGRTGGTVDAGRLHPLRTPRTEHRLGLWFRDHPEDRREFVSRLLAPRPNGSRWSPFRRESVPGAPPAGRAPGVVGPSQRL